ncbi:hypothetical protein [Paludifilum halophilum]|uniref:Uncharacterized protein n=1 Tax=Paludifilum halophilum TaxID=1642702 RepID=A0A235B284_9BACL|nr:hypothetical protein [Paludifilum halophilum]OYD06059.1 hypothetical protein CHM34_18335 [Paludifilum halophilum]
MKNYRPPGSLNPRTHDQGGGLRIKTELEIKGKLLEAVALVDMAADAIDGEKKEQLKRISTEIFDIECDI